jgi:hypothetical protein
VPNVRLNTTSLVLATVQQVGRPAVRAAVRNIAHHRVTIYLAQVTAKPTVVAWFVVN